MCAFESKEERRDWVGVRAGAGDGHRPQLQPAVRISDASESDVSDQRCLGSVMTLISDDSYQ